MENLADVLSTYQSELANLFRTYKCQKIDHHYQDVYEKDFSVIRNLPLNILEVGIWKGPSISAWLKYFPNASIYGVDVFTRMKPEEIPVLNHKRVKWLKVDSTHPTLPKKIQAAWGDTKFDIIIDDGKHTPQAQMLTFQNLIDRLNPGGAFYIEDVFPLDEFGEAEWNTSWLKTHSDTLTLPWYQELKKVMDSYNAEHINLRAKSGKLDSTIFKVVLPK
jgi:hypothetical protein